MQKYVIASNNEHKVKEFQNMLKPFGIKVVPYKDVIKEECEIEETGKTFEENAKIKAEAICEKDGETKVGFEFERIASIKDANFS